jgi:hypothetical protein
MSNGEEALMTTDDKTNGWEKEAKYVNRELERLSKGDEILHTRLTIVEDRLSTKIDSLEEKLTSKITTTREQLDSKISTTSTALGLKIDSLDVRLSLLQVKVAGIGAGAGLVTTLAFLLLNYLMRGK